jgi:drug/metabolite transporter (DMT)-like permease
VELGVLLTMIAAASWGTGDVFARRAMFGAGAETVLIVMIAMVILTLGVVGIAVEGAGAFVPKDGMFLLLTAFMGLLTWVTGNLLYFHGMTRAGVVIAAPILGAAPLIAILFAVTLGGERPGPMTLVGSFAVVAGVAVLVTDRQRVQE